MNPPRTSNEVYLTSALYQLRLGNTPQQVAEVLERMHGSMQPGEGAAWVARAQAAAAAGAVVENLLPGQSVGEGIANPLQPGSVLVQAVATYGTRGGGTRYATIRVRTPPGTTLDSVRDLLVSRAEGDDTLPAAAGEGELVGVEITHAW